MNMNDTYPFPVSATKDRPQTKPDTFAERYVQDVAGGVNLSGHEMVERKSWVGYRAPMPWDNATHEERRAAYGGFLFPAWYPFAVLEGNFAYQSPHFDRSHLKAPKPSTETDESLEQRKKQFAVPMVNKNSYTPNVPAAPMKRAKAH